MNNDDIINLNVGGTKLTTLRSTLCQVEDSLLAAMFSGRWEDNIKRDQDGAVFFDFNPQYFVLILDYLREKKISTLENPPPLPRVPEDQEESFYRLVQYLGLSNEISMPYENTRTPQSERFSLLKRSHGTSLEEGRKVAVCDKTGPEYVLGENVYNGGTVNMTLELQSHQSVFVGITEGDLRLLSQNMNALSTIKRNLSCRWPGSYGWALNIDHYRMTVITVYQDGSCTTNTNSQRFVRLPTPYTVKLVLECEKGKLSSTIGTEICNIDIPKRKMWRLAVTLYDENQTIRIMDD